MVKCPGMVTRRNPAPSNPGAPLVAERIGSIESTEDDGGVTRARRDGVSPRACRVTYEGDFNASNAVCYFAGDVAAGIFRVPRCRRADSPSVDNSDDFFGGAFLQRS